MVKPSVTTEYTLTVTNGTQTIKSSLTITVSDNSDTEPPTKPLNLQLSVDEQKNIDLKWTASTDNIGVAFYEIFCNEVYHALSETNSIKLENPKKNTELNFKVRAVDYSGNKSEFSNIRTIFLDTEAPTIPQNLTAKVEVNKVTLNWGESTDNTILDGYEIERNNVIIAKVFTNNYVDNTIIPDKTVYRVRAIDKSGNTSEFSNSVVVYLSNIENEKPLITDYYLNQNYPNPFNPTTKIAYGLKNCGFVSIKVFDLTGRMVATLVDEEKNSGNHSVDFNAFNLPSGIYIYSIQTNNYKMTRKMILVK